ncbi:MAG: protein kinase [Gemmatimonadetes bacterium]|nr:protein kinase [Gemmatimonadota bacterium]
MADNPLERLQAALADRYAIERELGRGGMATVYLAHDVKHHRKVAIKVLLPELAAVLGADRFLNEIRVTANLHHPNIVQLYDSGEADGDLYYVMPFIEGESLRDKLDRERQLSVEEAVEITRVVAGALDYAHRRDVIHRDIKPDNIMLHEGTPMVADFGIALAVDLVAGDRITATGLSLGTPYYMSPEQATGNRDAKPTTDIYALGCVLYEMLAGDPPFTGSNVQAVIAQVVTEKPVKLRTLRDTVPAHIEAAVDKALAKVPADRFKNTKEFADALVAKAPVASVGEVTTPSPWSRTARIAVPVAAVAVLAWALFGRGGGQTSTGDLTGATTTRSDLTYLDLAEDPRPAIAVLPFADMSPERDQEYFSDGISEEILTVLSKIRGLRVAARSSAFMYKGRGVDLRQVGEELGVAYLLDGSVRKDGDQLRISVELVSASNGFRLWSQTYNRRLEKIFAIQTEIAEAIIEALRVPLGLSQEALVSPTLDMDAYDVYLRGRAAMRRRGPGIGEAVRLFEASIARDSMWAPAWAGLAESLAISPLYTGLGRVSTDSVVWAGSLAAAETAAHRALDLDHRNASARVALGGVHRDRWEWENGEREFLRALEFDPDNEEAHTQYAELLWGMGRMDESLRETGRALALDRAPIRLDIHGFMLYVNGRAEEAEAMLEEGLAIDTAGDMHFLRTVLANLMLFDGRYREAIDRFASYLPDPAGYRQMGEALEAGDPALLPKSAGRGWPQALVLLGEPDRALDALEEMVFAMPFRVQYDIWDPILAPIWDTPRFQDVILPRVRLEGVAASFAASPENP